MEPVFFVTVNSISIIPPTLVFQFTILIQIVKCGDQLSNAPYVLKVSLSTQMTTGVPNLIKLTIVIPTTCSSVMDVLETMH